MNHKPTLSDRKRAAIIDAAIHEFRGKGFQAASMDSLAARAQVSKRTVYNHFANKEALFQEIARQLFDYAQQATQMHYQDEQTLTQQLLDFAQREMQLLASEQYRDMAKMMLAECIRSPEVAAQAAEQLEQREHGLEHWIQTAVQQGKLRAVEPGYAASQLLGIIKSRAFWPQVMQNAPVPSHEQQQRIAEDAVNMFLGFYAVPVDDQ